ncbi:oncostatin-M-specific receptor subunit beta isoform X2 [Echinops telfairi]|uniref:Oncostatin-M-specific receptor subunit beta isoform X2 n=1 Tax=Echinops telfairi TaxID=9371 RepID=A0AC55CQE4_ECHTE|nr:oncostatin-M-specific receptor subunit beta isoform X2 [Echinops telfairi]
MAAPARRQPTFLLVLLSLGMGQLKGLSEPLSVNPDSLEFAINLTYQRFSLLWSVRGLLDHQEIQMNFQIQISRINESNVIWTGNYITTVKSKESVHWSWESELPLECATHFVRIRSQVDDAQFPELRSWSKWTSWKEIRVLKPLSPGQTFSLFPKDNLVEAGSNMTVCYVSRSHGSEIACFLETEEIHEEEALTPHVTVFTLRNVSFLRPTGTNMHCRQKSTNELKGGLVIYVSKILEDPKNFSCETQDLKTLNCTWDPVAVTAPVNLHPSKRVQPPESYALYESFSQETRVCEHNTWCTWQVAEDSQDEYNFTLRLQNIFRERSVNLAFNLTHRVHPRPPFNFFLESVNSTNARVSWKVYPLRKPSTLLCRVECLQDEHVMEQQVNVSIGMQGEYLLSGLEPDTQYLARVCCAYGNHLWKWSDWVGQRFTTLDVAPSAPDMWRTVDPVPGGYNVTLYWKLLPKDHPRRKVLFYNITVENLDESTSTLLSVPATHSDTAVALSHSTYRISVTATSRGGTSPASALVVSGDSGDEKVEEERVVGTAEGILLSWKPRSGDAEGYVVEWYEQALGPLHGLQWKKLGPKTTHTVISPDAFRPGIRYNFRIYELSTKLMAFLLEKKTGYYQELVPLVNPQVTVEKMNAHSFTLSWKDYSTESQHGFIRGYYVYLKPKMQHCTQEYKKVALTDNSSYCKYKINDPEQKTFVVKHLQPQSVYEFFVTPFTSVGEGPNGTFMAITTTEQYNQMLLRVLLPMGFCAALLVVIFYMKIQWMKQRCYPDIPDPYKSSILSLIKSKQSSNLTLLSPQDCTPDAIEVVHKLEGSKTQLTQKSVPKTELPLSASPQLADQSPSGGRACICFENLTYNQQVPEPCSCGHSPVPPTTQAHPLGLFSSLENIWKDYMTSLGEVPAGETGVNYVSQLTSPVSGGKDGLPIDPLVVEQCSEYKIQMVVPLGAPSSPHTEDRSLSSSAP